MALSSTAELDRPPKLDEAQPSKVSSCGDCFLGSGRLVWDQSGGGNRQACRQRGIGELQRWIISAGDIVQDPSIGKEIQDFIRRHGAKSVVVHRSRHRLSA